MNINAQPSPRLNRLSPPVRLKEDTPGPEGPVDQVTASPPEETKSTGWMRMGMMALAAGGTLAGCTPTTPPLAPAENAGAYVMQDPTFVVIAEETPRIDLARKSSLDCPPGYKDISECTRKDEPYSAFAIHLGHGIVEDFNGNLAAIPSLAVANNSTAVLENPDHLSMTSKTLFGGDNDVDITQTKPGEFKIDYHSPVGGYKVRLNGSHAEVSFPDRWDGEYKTFLTIDRQSDSRVVVDDGSKTNVQSQGDHIAVQGAEGGYIRRLEYGDDFYTKRATGDNLEQAVTYNVVNGELQRPVDAPWPLRDYTAEYQSKQLADGSFQVGWSNTTRPVVLKQTGEHSGTWTQGRSTYTWEGGRLVNGPF